MPHVSAAPPAPRPSPWYREVTRDQWTAFIGSYAGWVLDGFDDTILTFLLVDVHGSFEVKLRRWPVCSVRSR